LVLVRGEGWAAKVRLILVISARFEISQFEESTLVKKIDERRTFAGCKTIAIVFNGSFGVVDGLVLMDGLGLMDGLRVAYVVRVMDGGVGVLVVGHASFEVDLLFFLLGGTPVARSVGNIKMILDRWKITKIPCVSRI
jgi:hypothetical protein